MPSMKDVAILAGVSTSTVSRVINNSMPVDEETRLKVERAIRTVNFKPSLVARGLRTKSANLIGIIVFVLIFVIGTAFNVAISGLGAYVHTARLQYVEFFGKFYEGGGKGFKVFRNKTKYINME